MTELMLSAYPRPWLGGEPRVFAVHVEDEFPQSWKLEDARLVEATYTGGGVNSLFDAIARAAQIAGSPSFQALLENLEDLSKEKPLVVFVRNAERLLADVGPALVHVLTGWERFARHGTGVSSMYLVVEMGHRATVDAAFYPGGKVEWL